MSQIGSYSRRPSSADIRRRNLVEAAGVHGWNDAERFKNWMLSRAGKEATFLHNDMWDAYRKGLARTVPPKMIYTVADLKELPVGSVIRDVDGDVSELRNVVVDRNEGNRQLLAQYEKDLAWCGREVIDVPSVNMGPFLPATVLHEPTFVDPEPWHHHGPNTRLSQTEVDAHNAASHAWDGLAFKPRTQEQYEADQAAQR